MALLKVKDFDPNYLDTFGGDDIKGRDIYTQGTTQKIGEVDDILVDENTGEFRYLILNLGVVNKGKKVLLPIGRSRMNPDDHRVYASITQEQANNLPELEVEAPIDYDHEEQVRGVYRQNATTASSVTPITPLESANIASMSSVESSAPLGTSIPAASSYASTSESISQPYNRDSYHYQNEPTLYGMNDQDHQTLRLYEERLIANKQRVKTGEVAIGKHVETETARVAVPVEKERVVVERVTPLDAGKPVSPDAANFREGEVAHMEIYEEVPDIHKEAVVREEVRVRKVVEQKTVEATDTVRHEELDVNAPGLPIEER